MPKIQHFSYSTFKKLEILQYVKLHSLRVAAYHFTIDYLIISYQERKKEKLKSVRGNNQHIDIKRKAYYFKVETCLKIWLLEF